MLLRVPPPRGRRVAFGLAVPLAAAVIATIAARAQTATPGPAQGTVTAAQPPAVMPPAPEQPIPYSHKKHLALGLECRQCHVNPDAGELMTFPKIEICMGCHQAIATDKPAIQKLAGFAKAGTPVPWVRVYDTPDYVFWSHGAHLAAKVDCVECHGKVADQEVMQQQTDVVTMLGCRRCHDAKQVFTDCGDCHEPRQ